MSGTMTTSVIVLLLLAFLGTVSAQSHCPVTNVCFALDDSGTIKGDWDKVTEFTKETAEIVWGRNTPVFSAWAFDDSAEQIVTNPTASIGWFKLQIDRHTPRGGLTNMYAGVKSCFDFLKDKEGKKSIVLVTDGLDNGKPTALEFVNMNRGYGIDIITVGIGSDVNDDYLKKLATTDEDGKPFYISTSMASLTAKAAEAAEEICVAARGTRDNCLFAYNACDFKFEGRDEPPTFWCCGRPNTPLGSKIVSKSGPQIGIVNSNGIVPEFINDDGTMIPITSVGRPPLTPTHYKPFAMRGRRLASTVGQQSYSGNQVRNVKGRCVRLFFSTYQELTRGGGRPRVASNVNVDKRDNKCVVFRIN